MPARDNLPVFVINRITAAVKKLLAHPATRDLPLDDPRTTEIRRAVIQQNRFLWRVYDEWYRMIADRIPEGPGRVLEIGSGGGFLDRYVPGLLTSEVFLIRDVRLVLDARRLPFASASLKAITMVDVLHHVPDVAAFLREAQRCLRREGVVIMVEPWLSAWSRLIYTRLHHEPFNPEAKDWVIPETGPLSGANGALPWIIFERDRRRFQAEFPNLNLAMVRPFMPFRYLVSGGVSMRQLMPQALFKPWRMIDGAFEAWPRSWPMFALIQLVRS